MKAKASNIFSSHKDSLFIIDGPGNYASTRNPFLYTLINHQKKRGIYICFDNTISNFKDSLIRANIPSRNLFVIDTSGAVIRKNEISKEAYYAKGPDSLSEISIALSDILHKEKINFVVLDSLSTLMRYNNFSTACRFVRYLLLKLREKHIQLILLGYKEELPSKFLPYLNKISGVDVL